MRLYRTAELELKWILLFLLVILLALYMTLRHPTETPVERVVSLKQIRNQGVLKIVTMNSPATFYNLRDQNTGFEYDLASEFAAYLGVRLDVNVAGTYTELIQQVRDHQVDLAAASLTVTPQRETELRFGPTYDTSRQVVIYRRSSNKPNDVTDLVGKSIAVIKDSSYSETLEQLAADVPELRFDAREGLSLEDLFQAVTDRELDLTIADDTLFEHYQRYFPRLDIAFALSEVESIAWAIPADADPLLGEELDLFFDQITRDGKLEELKARHRAYLDDYNVLYSPYFLKDIQSRLPQLRPLFDKAASQSGLDWRLLAAVAYQESHWKEDAVSPTGVAGIMMLTQRTAGELDVTDRLDPEQSILGGARYLGLLKEKIPDRIDEPDRTWLALAAYNLGYGHLEDARIVTQRLGENPDIWSAVSRNLPSLAKPEIYKTVRRGYANGAAAVHYVRNIRSYYDILIWKYPD